MLEGRDDETIEQCMRDVARTVQKSLDIPLENIRVLVNEVPKNRFSVGDQLKSEV
jgi:4-oxalocrotonate tautomerase